VVGVKRIYGVLAAEVAVVAAAAVAYNPLDFSIYLWGGEAVADDARLYLEQGYAHWFTYSPFAALVFAILAAFPAIAVRVMWQLASVAALAGSIAIALRLSGRRLVAAEVAAFTAAALLLEPVYHTLYQGQINLILMALALLDVWLVSQGRRAGYAIGIAAAIKLTPAIFVVMLLATGRRTAVRAALTVTATFLACGLAGFLVAPEASRLYWSGLFHDISRVGVPYISNQSPLGAAARIMNGVDHVGLWLAALSLAIGAAGLALAVAYARRNDWLAAAATTGVTGLLVSPISWTHHWVWVVPALIVLFHDGRRYAAAAGFLLFALAPLWWTPHFGGSAEYGLHGFVTLVANSYLLAGLGFLAYMAARHRLGFALTVPRPALPRHPTDLSVSAAD
jgi:alpha-1,2-mannosyltransferase